MWTSRSATRKGSTGLTKTHKKIGSISNKNDSELRSNSATFQKITASLALRLDAVVCSQPVGPVGLGKRTGRCP